MNSIFIILLGCNIYSILINRIETSINFIENNFKNEEEETKITWFLSGGIKNNFIETRSEASIMKSHIDNHIETKYNIDSITTFTHESSIFSIDSKYSMGIDGQIESKTYKNVKKSNISWEYILDEKSTNTAENFIIASNYLNITSNPYDKIFVVTSDFHFVRANYMLSLIDMSKKFEWILADMELDDSKHWEQIHIKNVFSDVQKAKTLIT